MNPDELNKLIIKQDSNFTKWYRTITDHLAWYPDYRPKWKKFHDFFKVEWSRFINKWYSYFYYEKKSDYANKSWKNSLNEWVSYSHNLGYPREDLILGGEEPMTDQDLSQFRELCNVSLLVDEQGVNPILCASVDWKGQKYRRCVELGPLVRMLADKIREYHDSLHSQTSVSGYDESYLHGTTSMDEIAGAKRKKRKRSKYLSDRTPPRRGRGSANYDYGYGYPETPQYPRPEYQADGMTLEEMREMGGGSHDWSQPYDSEGFSDLGYETIPPGIDPLQVSGWYDTIVKTARQLGESKAIKTLYADLKNLAQNKEFQKLALSETIGPLAGPVIDNAYKIHDLVVSAKKGNLEAKVKLEALKTAADAGNEAAQVSLETAVNINNQLKAKENNTEVSGWLYNKPYRSTTDVLTAPLRDEFPTVGLFMRQAWHDALEFTSNMKRKKLIELGA